MKKYIYSCPKCKTKFNPDDNCYLLSEYQNTIFICPECNKKYESQDDLIIKIKK